MSRPRRPHRPPHRPARANPQQVARRSLRRVHRQLESGQYAQAYPTLKRLADDAAQREMPVQAATLYARAARARIEMAAPGAHNAAWDAVDLEQRALHLLSGAGQTARAQRLLAQMLRLLERKNYSEQAIELRAEGTALLGARVQPAPAPQTALPESCPACNARLRSDEVEWIDAQRAECAYCGAVVEAE
jgi:hypothetical protein